jgi:hypothetical protein
MAEFPAFTSSPARVHDRARALIGHHPCWLRRQYDGGLYSLEHFRVCSYCGCIHPRDMIDLLEAGGSSFESSPKLGKFFFITPNPIAGKIVRMGSVPGRIFERNREPANLRHRLTSAPRRELPFSPSVGERLMGHFERPALQQAPEAIRWVFYAEHMFGFGAGALWGTPLTDYAGNAIANPTPILFGTLQDVSMDISFDVKELHGENQFPGRRRARQGQDPVQGQVRPHQRPAAQQPHLRPDHDVVDRQRRHDVIGRRDPGDAVPDHPDGPVIGHLGARSRRP